VHTIYLLATAKGPNDMTGVEALVAAAIFGAVWLYYRRQAQRQQAKSNHPSRGDR
jgi:hypothetical protein